MSGIMKGRVTAVYPQRFPDNTPDDGKAVASLQEVS
jgi:hypothetical protein